MEWYGCGEVRTEAFFRDPLDAAGGIGKPMYRRNYNAWLPEANRPNRSALTLDPCAPRSSFDPHVPTRLDRAIAARWKHWVPWVRMYLLRACQSDPSVNPALDSPDSRRLRL